MDVFISKIALKENITKNDIFSIVKMWLENSPNYKISVDYNGIDETYITQGTTDSGTLKLSVVSTNLNDSEILACHFENNEENNCWITDCIHNKNEDQNIFSIKLSCKTKSYSKLPKVHKPYLIKLLMEKNYCKDNDLFPITDRPIILRKSQLKCCADIILGKVETTLPIVYISFDMVRDDLYAVNAEKLAKNLSGLAHVLVEPDFEFSRQLSKISERRKPINGYIGIYFPNTKYMKTIPDIEDGIKIKENVLTKKIFNILIETSLNCIKTADLNWESLQVQLTKCKYEKQKRETNKTSKELDEFLSAYDEEVTELKKQIDDLNSKIVQKEQENYNLQNKIDGLSTQFENLKIKKDCPTISFTKGNSIEFFSNEIKETILNILFQCIDKLDKNGRPYIILREFLKNNALTNCGKQYYEDIRRALKEKSLDARRKRLEKSGFTVDKDDHDKIRLKGLNDYMFTLAGSASDHRDPENAFHEILKKVDVYIKFN